ncbi:MAG: hypothetical protein DMF91_15875 [Acidobacteria bacterium]|nr:MAG: hypothetical protein DMF91_15875 [Acidobacteriota bacterium]
MLDGLFQFLFKYRPLVFEQGDFVLGASRPMRLVILAAAAAAAYALFTYRRAGRAEPRDRLVLAGLRMVALAVIVFCLFRPALILKAAVPQQNFLGILIDDSRSMQIADRQGQTRSDFVQQQLVPSEVEPPLLNALSQRFVLRFFRFSSSADRVASAEGLKYGGTSTRLGEALARARDELSGLPLAGLVMVTDGADTSDASLDESLASIKARSIPVFTVGVGAERFARDIQVTRVETPRTALKGTSLVVNVVVTQTGYGGSTVPIEVEDNGHIVSTEQVTLPPDGESATVRVRFTASDAGPRVFKFRVPPQPNEQVVQNNTREALIEVSDRKEKILYFEGEPRPEANFARRAVDEDKNLQLVVLQRTAQDKYFRQNVSGPDELLGGFPATREELFAYRGIILGSVEADSFTPEQLRMVADFVNKRGGGLMMLGGRRSFAEGGWTGTPLAEVLPVVLDGGANKSYFTELSVRPTRAGATYPVTQIADTEDASLRRWDKMPELSAVNLIRTVKPGATVLLEGVDNRRLSHVVLTYQRYGRGKALAFPVQDSWMWRMDITMDVKDTTHRTFWRRLARWLVEGVPDHVVATTVQDRVDPGEAVPLTAQVVDSSYNDVNNARVVAHVTAPSGKTSDVPMDWSVTREGEYRGSFVPDEEGVYDIRVGALRDQKELGADDIHVRSSAGDGEYFDAAMRAPLLKRIAEETEGRFFTPETVTGLPEAISLSGRGVTVVEERELWDMPVLLLLLIACTGTEWAYRRTRGLA